MLYLRTPILTEFFVGRFLLLDNCSAGDDRARTESRKRGKDSYRGVDKNRNILDAIY